MPLTLLAPYQPGKRLEFSRTNNSFKYISCHFVQVLGQSLAKSIRTPRAADETAERISHLKQLDEPLAPFRYGVIGGALYASKPSASLGLGGWTHASVRRKDGNLHKRPPGFRPLTPFS